MPREARRGHESVSRRRIILRAEVPADLLGTHDYLSSRSPETAIRFLHGAQVTLDRLVASPGIGSPKPFRGRLKGVRSWPVEGFPNHLVYYIVAREAIVVLGILHGARDIAPALRPRRP